MKRFGKNLDPATQQEAATVEAEVEQPAPVTPLPEPLPENCPRCSDKLPPPFKSSGRTFVDVAGLINRQSNLDRVALNRQRTDLYHYSASSPSSTLPMPNPLV